MPESKRLQSLDALRGFDMFWIVGGASLVIALAEITNSGTHPLQNPTVLEMHAPGTSPEAAAARKVFCVGRVGALDRLPD